MAPLQEVFSGHDLDHLLVGVVLDDRIDLSESDAFRRLDAVMASRQFERTALAACGHPREDAKLVHRLLQPLDLLFIVGVEVEVPERVRPYLFELQFHTTSSNFSSGRAAILRARSARFLSTSRALRVVIFSGGRIVP